MCESPDEQSPDQPPAESAESPESPERPEPEWQRRRRLAAVFGDAMPDTTSDERAPETAEDASAEDAGDRWLRSQVPPHHG
jgi:hypothetical protein